MYQTKLEEMTAAFQNMQSMQNLQIMTQKMNDITSQMHSMLQPASSVVSLAPTKSEKQQEEEQPEKQEESEESEFVFNPDPDFLAKINANIRQNNQMVCGALNQQAPLHHQVDLQAEEEEEEEYLAQEEQFAALDSSSSEEPEVAKQDSPQQLQDEPQQAMISDCGSDIQIEEAEQHESPRESREEAKVVQGTQGDFKAE